MSDLTSTINVRKEFLRKIKPWLSVETKYGTAKVKAGDFIEAVFDEWEAKQAEAIK